jgi:hypothetical protein
MSGEVKAKLNLIQDYIEMIEKNAEKEKTFGNYGLWANILYKQMN